MVTFGPEIRKLCVRLPTKSWAARRPKSSPAWERMPVTVVLDNIRSAQNVGSFFRTADAFAAERICLCGITAVPPAREIHKTALGAELTVAWSRHERTADCLEALRREGLPHPGRGAGRRLRGPRRLPPPRRAYATPWSSATRWRASRAGGGRCLRRCDRDSAGRHETFAQRLGGGGVVLWKFFCGIGPKR